MTTFEYKILTTEAEVEAIADQWRALYARLVGSPVTDYDRFSAWWRTIGMSSGARGLHVVTGWSDGKLAAVLPLSIMRSGKGIRMLQSDGGMAFECCDVLCENADQAKALWDAARRSPHYDFGIVMIIYRDSIGYPALASFAHRHREVESFFLRFQWPSSKEWLASLSGNTRGNFKRCSRRLEEKGALRYEVCTEGPLPPEIVDGMVKQKLAWCDTREKRGLFDHPRIRDYFHEMSKGAAGQGRLFLAWLKCGDDVIAYNFGFVARNAVHMFFWTYDPAWSAWSPGNVIMVNSICWALDHGLGGIDFMYTTESSSEKYFKQKYSNQLRHCDEFTFSGSFKGRLMEAAFLAKRALRKKIAQLKQLKNRKPKGDDAPPEGKQA